MSTTFPLTNISKRFKQDDPTEGRNTEGGGGGKGERGYCRKYMVFFLSSNFTLLILQCLH